MPSSHDAVAAHSPRGVGTAASSGSGPATVARAIAWTESGTNPPGTGFDNSTIAYNNGTTNNSRNNSRNNNGPIANNNNRTIANNNRTITNTNRTTNNSRNNSHNINNGRTVAWAHNDNRTVAIAWAPTNDNRTVAWAPSNYSRTITSSPANQHRTVTSTIPRPSINSNDRRRIHFKVPNNHGYTSTGSINNRNIITRNDSPTIAWGARDNAWSSRAIVA